jgi:predicted outer membrane lipoprotein
MAMELGSVGSPKAVKRAGQPIRWSWILAVCLGCLLGLLTATWLGETGARLGQADEFDMVGME